MHKILIVDDEKEVVETMRNYLERQGYEIFCAYDGEEAKSQVGPSNPDVILLDLIMPKCNGFEVLKWIRENMQRRIPVVILSVKDKLDDIRKGYDFDADFYLPKPFTNHELLKGIKTVLSLNTFRKEQAHL